MTSSIYPLVTILDTEVDSPLVIDVAGTGYEIGDALIFDPPPYGTTATADVATVGGSGEILTLNFTNQGQGYISPPNITITSVNGVGGVVTATNITQIFVMDENILVNDVEITPEMVTPGGGGTVRLLFSYESASGTDEVSVFNNGFLKGKLNADNSFSILSDGYYRFDIDVEAGDNLNIQINDSIDTIHSFRMHLVQIGA